MSQENPIFLAAFFKAARLSANRHFFSSWNGTAAYNSSHATASTKPWRLAEESLAVETFIVPQRASLAASTSTP